MKYMKLGSKPDIFQSHGSISIVVSDLTSDVSVEVNGARFLLHKFPLLSKSGRLHKLVAESSASARGDESSSTSARSDEISLKDFPGGAETFEVCAKFCYGITVTLNAYNVVAVRCAAEYLEMSEAIEKGNLIFKLEVFLNSSIFRSWKDSIIALRSTKALLPVSEELKIIARCVDSIAAKTSVDPAKVDWSYTYTRITQVGPTSEHMNWKNPNPRATPRPQHVPKDWWVEDICELDIDFFWRVMLAIKARGRMSHELIGGAIQFYSYRWLPMLGSDALKNQASTEVGEDEEDSLSLARHKIMLETLVGLLPPEKACTSCSFLLKLLRVATVLNAAGSARSELARRVGLQLEDAGVRDLLIPKPRASSMTTMMECDDSVYDVGLVLCMVEHFLMQDHQSPPMSPAIVVVDEDGGVHHEHRRTRSAENLEFTESRRSTSAAHSSKLRVGKLIDGYLAEVARDKHLSLSKFIALAESIPEFARPVHDGIYRAIDIYLKEHPGLSKSEKKKLCRLMDCKKLSMEACMHAAQNDRLPLRVVVQVLFFDQVRAAMAGGIILNDIPGNIRALLPPGHQDESMLAETIQSSSTTEDNWDSVQHDFKALKGDLATMKQRIAEAERERSQIQLDVASRQMQIQQQQQQQQGLQEPDHQQQQLQKPKKLFSNPRKIFSKFFSTKLAGNSETTSKSSDTSRSSGSPVSGTVSSGKTSVAAARHRQLSIS